MSIWPPLFQTKHVPGKSAIEGLAFDMFGVTADDPNCPECVMRWATFSLLRLLSEGDANMCAKLDEAIAQAAADFKGSAH